MKFAGRDARLVWIEESTAQKPAEPSTAPGGAYRQSPFGGAGNAFWLMDLNCRITQCDQSACDLFGKTREEITGRHCWELVHCTAEPVANCPCRRMLLSHHQESTVLNLGARWYQVSVRPRFRSQGERVGAFCTMLDITESKAIEAALQHTERIFRQLANAMPQLVWIADSAGVVSFYNDRVSEYSGAVRKPDGTWDRQQLVHPDDLGAALAARQAAARAGLPYTVQQRIRMADGNYRWHLSRALPVKDASGGVSKWFGTATDIHDLKMATEALHKNQQELEQRVAERTTELAQATDRLQKEMIERTALQRELFTAGEHERERLGQDLHDGLCQLLTGIRCKTERLTEDLAADSPAARGAQTLYELLTQAMREARGLARGLQPVARVPEGLMHGLLELAGATRELFKLRCECRFPQPVLLDDHRMASELYRVAQEAVSNAARHGKPTFIRIGLKRIGDRLVLTITSDGKPFRMRAGTKGMGLKTMRARAEHIGATLMIAPIKSGGTVVRCALAVPESKPSDAALLTRSR